VRIVVTGGAGFIGSHLVEALDGSQHDVVVVDDFSGDSVREPPPGVELRRIDCRNHDQLCRAVEGAESIVHLAASVLIRGGHANAGEDIDRGLAGTHGVLEAARRTGVRHVCFASSSTVYGDGGDGPLDEDAPLRPISLYSASKVAGEAFINAYAHLFGISATILRFGIVLGPGLRRGVIFDFVRRLRADTSKLRIMGDGRQCKPYVAIEDAISAIQHLGLEPQHGVGIYNVTGEGAVTVIEIAGEVLGTLGLEGTPVVPDVDPRGWPGDIPDLKLSISRALAAGWAPRYSAHQAVGRGVRAMVAEAVS
jgi:UDP-glucose 4-epimerase